MFKHTKKKRNFKKQYPKYKGIANIGNKNILNKSNYIFPKVMVGYIGGPKKVGEKILTNNKIASNFYWKKEKLSNNSNSNSNSNSYNEKYGILGLPVDIKNKNKKRQKKKSKRKSSNKK